MHPFAASNHILLLMLSLLVAAPAAWAQVPQTVAFQGYLTDEEGAPVEQDAEVLTFRLYDQAEGGQPLWTEEHDGVPVSGGVFSVYLGSETGIQDVPFDQPLWLSVAVGDQSADELAPRTALSAVPYALQGAEAELARSLDPEAAGIVTATHLAAGAVSAEHLAEGAVSLSDLIAGVDAEGRVPIANGEGGATWGSVTRWRSTPDAVVLTSTPKVGIGVADPSVGAVGLDMVGRLRLRPTATDNHSNLLVRPTWSQSGPSSVRVGLVADTVSTAHIAGVWMEAEPDGDQTEGSMAFVTGTALSNGGVVFGRRMTITADGLVGVGMSDPAERLDVNGNVQADQFLTPSDARLKERIENLTDARATVQSLRGVTFHWKDPERAEAGRQVGFIAQEVLQVLPEVVRQDDRGTYKVAYAQIVPVLVEALREQQRQIDALEQDVRALTSLVRAEAPGRGEASGRAGASGRIDGHGAAGSTVRAASTAPAPHR